MYDGSAAFDLPDAVYLGRALAEAVPLVRGADARIQPDRVQVARGAWRPLLVGETSDGSHLNTADFIASGCASYVRTSANHRGGITGAMRIAHLADSFRLRAEVHGRPSRPCISACQFPTALTTSRSLRRILQGGNLESGRTV